jgi:hypothetical protein
MKRSKSDLNDHNNNTRDIEHFWGFGDSSMTKDDMENVKILNKSLWTYGSNEETFINLESFLFQIFNPW